MPPTKLLLRAALRLDEAWSKGAHGTGSRYRQLMGQFDDCHLALTQARDRLAKASSLRLSAVLAGLHREVLVRLGQLHKVAGQIANEALETASVHSLPWFLAELQQIEADFAGVKIDLKEKTVSATTEPITLEEVYLGSFEICLRWEDAAISCNYHCFDVVALDPNPSGVDEDVTHPHLKRNKLCAGDAALPIKGALEQGRLADAFSLVHSVLTTYNPESPHVRLSEWNGTKCSDCAYSIPSGDAQYCEGCDSEVCNDCASICSACENTRCMSCLEACAVCQQSCCPNCLVPTAAADCNCCPHCIRKCPRCKALFAKDKTIQASDLCTACRSSSATGGTAANTLTVTKSKPIPSDEDPNHATPLESNALPISA